MDLINILKTLTDSSLANLSIIQYNYLTDYNFFYFLLKFSNNSFLQNKKKISISFSYSLLNILISSFVKNYFLDAVVPFHEESHSAYYSYLTKFSKNILFCLVAADSYNLCLSFLDLCI